MYAGDAEGSLVDKKLHCLGKEPAPSPVVQGWSRYLELPPDAQVGIWKIVVDAIAHPEDDRSEERVQALCGVFDLELGNVVQAALSAQFMLANSCATGLDQKAFQEDLVVLSDGEHTGIEIIASRYETVRSELQNLELFRTLAAHDKVLKDVSWRMDKVVSSNRGYHAEADVIFLTLEYQEGTDTSRITLQLAPEGLASLGRFMARIQS